MNAILALNRLRSLLPGDTPDKSDGEYDFEIFDRFIYDDEPELALQAVIYIAEAHCDKGTPLNHQFLVDARQIAVYLAEKNRGTTYSELFPDIIQTIDDRLRQVQAPTLRDSP